MAFGDNNDNNSRKFYEPTVYSSYGMSNTDGVDPSALNFQFSLGLLKITISPMKPGAKQGDKQLWDHDNAVSVWLTKTVQVFGLLIQKPECLPIVSKRCLMERWMKSIITVFHLVMEAS